MQLVLHGTPLSPFVRKVRAVMLEKGLACRLEPVSPFDPPDGWRALSPLGRVPVLVDEDRPEAGSLPDSSAICAFLEAQAPEPPLLPEDPWLRARTLWLEEFADTELAARIGFGIWRALVVGPLGGAEADEESARRTVEEKLPPSFDYLDGLLAEALWFSGPAVGLADIAIAAQLVGFRHGGFELDGGRWPRLAPWLEAICARASFVRLLEEDRTLLGEHSRLCTNAPQAPSANA